MLGQGLGALKGGGQDPPHKLWSISWLKTLMIQKIYTKMYPTSSVALIKMYWISKLMECVEIWKVAYLKNRT